VAQVKNNILKLIVILLCINPTLSMAGDMAYYEGLFNVYKNKLHPRIIRQIPSADRIKVSNLKLMLNRNPKLVNLVVTGKEEKTVYISVGFLDGLYNYVDCLLLEGQYNRDDICNDYYEYYFDKIISGSGAPPWAVARIFFGDNQKKLTHWSSNKSLDLTRNAMLISALINVMVHEYGHHVVGFGSRTDSVSKMRSLEGDVDKWSYSILHNIGEKPALGAVISLGYLAQTERYLRNLRELNRNNRLYRQMIRTHPKPKQRAAWAYNYTCGNDGMGTAMEKACDLLNRTIDSYE